MSDARLDLAAAAGVASGLVLFYKGFATLRLKRLVEALATSKTRSMAMGTVELCGFAAPYAELLDPVFGERCCYFNVEVKEQVGSGKHKRWVTVYRNTSDAVPLYLADDTGRVAIYPHGARLHMDYKVDLTTSDLSRWFSGAEDHIAAFVRKLNRSSGTLSIKARIVREHEPLYVLGYAVPQERPFTLRERVRLSLHEAARALKGDARRMKALDKDGDGRIDEREWDEGLRDFQKSLEAEAAQSRPVEPAPGAPEAVIRKTPDGLLLLANQAEKGLCAELTRSSLLQTFGGPALTLASAAFLAYRFGLLPPLP